MVTITSRADLDALPPELREQVRAQALADLARKDPLVWCRLGPPTQYGPMRPKAWQADAVARLVPLLREVAEGTAPTMTVVLVDAPQQEGKTEIIKRLLAWAMAELALSVGFIAYDYNTLASKHSRDIRRLLRSRQAGEVWPHLRNAPEQSSVKAWTVPTSVEDRPEAHFLATGRDGGLEGQALDVIVGDDLYKTVSDAASLANRAKVDDLLRSSVLGRLTTRGGLMIDIGTRRGQHDTKGWWAAREREAEAAGVTMRVIRLSYPLRGTEDWRHGPEGYISDAWTPEKEAHARVSMGRLAPILLDQQDPSDLGGLYPEGSLDFEYDEHPSIAARLCSATYLTVDAAETADGGDHTVIQHWGIRGSKSLFLRQWRGQWRDVDVVKQVRAAIEETRPAGVLIEDTSSGKVALAALRTQIPGIVPVKVAGQGSKCDRIAGTTLLWSNGDVLVPAPGPDTGWFYGRDEHGMDWRDRVYALKGDRPDMRGEVDDEADAATIFLRWRLAGHGGKVRAHAGFAGF